MRADRGLPRYPVLYTREQVTRMLIERDEKIAELRLQVKDLEAYGVNAGKLAREGILALNDGVHADRLRKIFTDIVTGGRR